MRPEAFCLISQIEMSTAKSLQENGHTIQTLRYRSRLKNWGRDHLREFPWRKTQDPYRVLMAEYMLLRTQAKQVVPVYTILRAGLIESAPCDESS